MQVSNTARLQNAVLRVAVAQDKVGLDLASTPDYSSLCDYLPMESVKPGGRVMVIGATDENMMPQIAYSVGAEGAMLVIESESEYLEQAMKQASKIEQQLGYANCHFEQAELDDLQTNPAFVIQSLAEAPITNMGEYNALQQRLAEQRAEEPLVPNDSFDTIILSIATVNRLPVVRARTMLSEAFRVLCDGGRLVLALFLTDEPLPTEPLTLSSRLTLNYIPFETETIDLLTKAGYYGMRYIWRAALPLRIVAGVEIRAFTIETYKGKQEVDVDSDQSVIYRGPWQKVFDDYGHCYVRGQQIDVSQETCKMLNRTPYQDKFITLPFSKGKKGISQRDAGCCPSSGDCC